MELVPDLATDLGTPNEDFTEWTFTIRDDATWENGEPGHRRGGRLGHLPVDGLRRVPVRPGHRVLPDLLLRRGRVQGPLHRQGPQLRRLGRHRGQRPGHHHQDGQAVPRHGLLGRLHGDGPGSARQGQRAAGLRPEHPVQRSLQGRELPSQRGARAGQERPVGPRTRTRRATSTPTSSSSSSTPTRPRSTRSCSATTPSRRRRVSTAAGLQQLRAGQHRARRPPGPAVLAVHELPGAGLQQDHRHQRPQGDRVGLPLRGRLAGQR